MAMYIKACKWAFEDTASINTPKSHAVYLFCSADDQTYRLDEIEKNGMFRKYGEDAFRPIPQIDINELKHRFIDLLPDGDVPRQGFTRLGAEPGY